MKVGPSYSLAFSPDGARVATISSSVAVFDLRSERRLFRSKPFRHPSEVVFSPDGQTLLVKGTSGRIALLDAGDGTLVRVLKEGTRGCAPRFSTCGRYALDGSCDGGLVVQDLATEGVAWSRQFPGEMIQAVHCLNTRSRWAVLHGPKATHADRPPAPTYISIWRHPDPGPKPCLIVRPGLSFVSASAPSPDGRAMAVIHGAPPSALSIVDLRRGTVHREVPITSGGSGTAVAWSRSQTIASVQKGRVELYSAPALDHLGGVALPYASDVDWSPDGEYIALGSWKAGLVTARSSIVRAWAPVSSGV